MTRTIGRITITPYPRRTRNERMGRFGGGWQWKLGFQAGDYHHKSGRTVIVSLLTREYRINIAPAPEQ